MSTSAPKSEAIAGELYHLLRAKLPICCNDNGILQVAELAARINMSAEGVYRWLRANEISKRGRKRVVELSERSLENVRLLGDIKPLTQEDLRPFS